MLHGERRVDVGLQCHARHDAKHAVAADDRAEERPALGRRGVAGARDNASVPADELEGHHALGHAKVGGDAVRVDADRAAHREGRIRLHRTRRAAVLIEVKQHVRPEGARPDGQKAAATLELHVRELDHVDYDSAWRQRLPAHCVACATHAHRAPSRPRQRQHSLHIRAAAHAVDGLDLGLIEPRNIVALGPARRRLRVGPASGRPARRHRTRRPTRGGLVTTSTCGWLLPFRRKKGDRRQMGPFVTQCSVFLMSYAKQRGRVHRWFYRGHVRVAAYRVRTIGPPCGHPPPPPAALLCDRWTRQRVSRV